MVRAARRLGIHMHGASSLGVGSASAPGPVGEAAPTHPTRTTSCPRYPTRPLAPKARRGQHVNRLLGSEAMRRILHCSSNRWAVLFHSASYLGPKYSRLNWSCANALLGVPR
jgi:hypothetical protein